MNPEYRKINYKIKKLAEKIQRREAKFYKVVKEINAAKIDKLAPLTSQQIKATEAISVLKNEKEILLKQRTAIPNIIKLKDMPDAIRYDKLKPESKLFMNVIKMICYRAETAMAETVAPYFYNQKEEKRMLVKQLFNTPADITANEEERTLIITIGSLSAPRYNEAIKKLSEILNETETIFPGTNLRLIYKNYAG